MRTNIDYTLVELKKITFFNITHTQIQTKVSLLSNPQVSQEKIQQRKRLAKYCYTVTDRTDNTHSKYRLYGHQFSVFNQHADLCQ